MENYKEISKCNEKIRYLIYIYKDFQRKKDEKSIEKKLWKNIKIGILISVKDK